MSEKLTGFPSVDKPWLKLYSEETINAKVLEAYKADGHRPGNIKSLQVYMNLNERRAYYVINGKEEGKFVEF